MIAHELVKQIIGYADWSRSCCGNQGLLKEWFRHVRICKYCLQTAGEHFNGRCIAQHSSNIGRKKFVAHPELTAAAYAIYRVHGGLIPHDR